MTGQSSLSEQKRLHSYALDTLRWAKNARNLGEVPYGEPISDVTVERSTVSLENNAKSVTLPQ